MSEALYQLSYTARVGQGGLEPPTVSLSGSRTNQLCYRPVLEMVPQGKMGRMFAILAVILFAIATLIAFTPLSGISVLGLVAAGLLCLTLHLLVPSAWGPAWTRRG